MSCMSSERLLKRTWIIYRELCILVYLENGGQSQRGGFDIIGI